MLVIFDKSKHWVNLPSQNSKTALSDILSMGGNA